MEPVKLLDIYQEETLKYTTNIGISSSTARLLHIRL